MFGILLKHCLNWQDNIGLYFVRMPNLNFNRSSSFVKYPFKAYGF